MAYAFTASVTLTRRLIGGRRVWRVVISETECAATSEWSVAAADADGGVPLPSDGTIIKYDAVKTAGDATTLRPMLSRTTAPASTQVGYIGQQVAAAASVHDDTPATFQGLSTLFGRTTPDAGTNNSISTEILIVEGRL